MKITKAEYIRNCKQHHRLCNNCPYYDKRFDQDFDEKGNYKGNYTWCIVQNVLDSQTMKMWRKALMHEYIK